MSVYECSYCKSECLTGITPGQKVICWCCDNEFEIPEPIGRLRADGAEEELQLCRQLLDSYGFHQVSIHNGIIAMQNKIESLEKK